MKKSNPLSVLSCLAIVLLFAVTAAHGEEQNTEADTVKEGKTVRVHYTLTVDGKVLDSSKDKEPLNFKVGSHQVIPGFEDAVIGMKPGEKKSFRVSPEEGYGPENPDAVQEIPRDKLPENITPEAGMTLYAKNKDGQPMPVRVVEVRKDVVVMDFNHPLAGKSLDFEVEIIEIF